MQELPRTVSCFLKNLGQSALRNVQFGFTLNGRARVSVYHRLDPEGIVAKKNGAIRRGVVEDSESQVFAVRRKARPV